MKTLTVRVTLAYQFTSQYYNKLDLNDLVATSVQLADQEVETYNIIYDEIEEGEHETIHENILNVIKSSQIVVAEISDLNQNVLYELGLAKGLNKQCILLREQKANEKLPFDIMTYPYIIYNSSNMRTIKNQLAGKIKRLILNLKPEDLFSQSSLEILVNNYIKPIETSKTLDEILNEVVDTCKNDFFYLGIGGFKSNDWLLKLQKKEVVPKIYRIANFKTIKEIYLNYNLNIEVATNYCFWLCLCYRYIKNKDMIILNSTDTSSWVAGTSFIANDNDKLIIFTGTFTNFENKGVLITDKRVTKLFFEYMKMLSVGYSQKVRLSELYQYFSFTEMHTSLPTIFNDVIDKEDLEALYQVCENYINDELNMFRK